MPLIPTNSPDSHRSHCHGAAIFHSISRLRGGSGSGKSGTIGRISYVLDGTFARARIVENGDALFLTVMNATKRPDRTCIPRSVELLAEVIERRHMAWLSEI
jgi:hypothetical protein